MPLKAADSTLESLGTANKKREARNILPMRHEDIPVHGQTTLVLNEHTIETVVQAFPDGVSAGEAVERSNLLCSVKTKENPTPATAFSWSDLVTEMLRQGFQPHDGRFIRGSALRRVRGVDDGPVAEVVPRPPRSRSKKAAVVAPAPEVV